MRFGTFPVPVMIPGWGMGGVSIPGVGGILGIIISQWGTSQQDGSFGSGTNEHPDGTREYLEHLQYKFTIHTINIHYTACGQKSFLFFLLNIPIYFI
jgi:hypothetical protein